MVTTSLSAGPGDIAVRRVPRARKNRPAATMGCRAACAFKWGTSESAWRHYLRKRQIISMNADRRVDT
jgi:hypothetical protein